MNCTPQALMDAAICYSKYGKHDLDAAAIYLLCAWAATGAGCQISWTPDTETPDWTDGSGPHTTDLATFLATVDYATFTAIDFTATSVSDFSIQNCPILQTITDAGGALFTVTLANLTGLTLLDLNSNLALSVLDLSGCPNLQTLDSHSCNLGGTLDLTPSSHLQVVNVAGNVLTGINAAGLSALTTLNCNSNQLGTIDLTGDFAITTLDVSSNPAVVIIGP